MVTNIGMLLDGGDSIDLRGRLDATAFLAIGDTVEIVLGESHVRRLWEQAGAALDDITLLEAADAVVGKAFDAGVHARKAAEQALHLADEAERAGAVEQASQAREAARYAAEAARRAQDAARAASEAMGLAEDAADRAADAAAEARRAAAAPGVNAGTLAG